MDLNLPQLDTLVKTLIEHDERMAQLLQQIVSQFAAVAGNMQGQQEKHIPEAITPEGQQYLRDNLDVARNPDFFDRPYLHYALHGKAEGRTWPGGTQTFPAGRVPEQVNVPTVTTPGGRVFPAPADSGENGMGYIQRVGEFLGLQEQWARVAGTLRLGTDHLVPKNVKYPDDYAAYKENRKNWPAMAEAFWFPTVQAADPGWQGVYDRLREQRDPVQLELPLEPPKVELPPGETPL